MLIEHIPYHLRHTVEVLDLPIYIDLTPDECRPPQVLALGDTLMVLGLIRNQGRSVRLVFDPGPARELVEAHPLVKELAPPDDKPGRLGLYLLPTNRIGRPGAWVSKTVHRLQVPVVPVDMVRANPAAAHSMFFRLPTLDDRPGVFSGPERRPAVADMLSRVKPTLVIYPCNPGRGEHVWQDLAWWVGLARRLKDRFAIVAVGGQDYGDLTGEVGACLSWKDPASSLLDLAWLLERAAAFAGRDGGISHLAAGVVERRVVVWDSMSSYRLWATRGGNHVLFSNPYAMRYPQTTRITLDDVRDYMPKIELVDSAGKKREIHLPKEGLLEKASELFGGNANDLLATVYAQRQEQAERQAVQSWYSQPQLREKYYLESWDFACRALDGQLAQGTNWVAPTWP